MSESVFDVAMDLVLGPGPGLAGEEGGYQCKPDDPGNWTGGKVGLGELKGTKGGISAASYPTLDIKNLSRGEIVGIYARDFWPYWAPLPPAIAVACADAAINSGNGGATIMLQHALNHLGVQPPLLVDGGLGAKTLAAALGVEPRALLRAVIAARFVYDSQLTNWRSEAWEWTVRMLDVFARCETLL